MQASRQQAAGSRQQAAGSRQQAAGSSVKLNNSKFVNSGGIKSNKVHTSEFGCLLPAACCPLPLRAVLPYSLLTVISPVRLVA